MSIVNKRSKKIGGFLFSETAAGTEHKTTGDTGLGYVVGEVPCCVKL
jgi:hypothetical protein